MRDYFGEQASAIVITMIVTVVPLSVSTVVTGACLLLWDSLVSKIEFSIYCIFVVT